MPDGDLNTYSKTELVVLLKQLQAELQLYKSHANTGQRFFMDRLPVGVFVCDSDGCCRFLNEEFARLIECKEVGEAPTPLVRAVHEGDRPRVLDAWQRAAKDGNPFSGICRLSPNHNGKIHIAGRCERHDGEDSKPVWIGAVVQIDDIEVDLKALGRTDNGKSHHPDIDLEPLAAHTRDLMIECDPHGQVTYANPPASAFYGGGDAFIDRVYAEDRLHARYVWSRIWEADGAPELRCRHTDGDGQLITIAWVFTTTPATAFKSERVIALGRIEKWPDPIAILSRQASLTAREKQILACAVKGLRNSDIAGRLEIQESTVKFHMNAIFRKTGTRNRTALAARVAELDKRT